MKSPNVSDIDGQNVQSQHSTELKELHKIVSTSLNNRAISLLNSAGYIIVIIVFLLILGVIVFVFASSITNQDLIKSSIDDRIDNNQNSLMKISAQLKSNSDRISAHLVVFRRRAEDAIRNRNIETLSSPLPNRSFLIIDLNLSSNSLEAYEAIVSSVSNDVQKIDVERSLVVGSTSFRYRLSKQEWNDLARDIQQATLTVGDVKVLQNEQQSLAAQAQMLNEVSTLLRQEKVKSIALGNDSPYEQKNDSASTLAQTSLTRFGALAIISFLVAILLSTYRYNTRLAAFYLARGDALLLTKPQASVEDLSMMITAFTPNLTFGRAPSTPPEMIIELVKAGSEASIRGLHTSKIQS